MVYPQSCLLEQATVLPQIMAQAFFFPISLTMQSTKQHMHLLVEDSLAVYNL